MGLMNFPGRYSEIFLMDSHSLCTISCYIVFSTIHLQGYSIQYLIIMTVPFYYMNHDLGEENEPLVN